VRPFEGVGIAQRVVVALGADVPRPLFRSFVRHSLHRLAARRARLPDRMEHGHLFPLRWHSSSADVGGSSWPMKILVGFTHYCDLLDSATAEHSTLGSDVEGGVSWSRSSTEVWPNGYAVWQKRLIRSPGVVSWISPSGMTPGVVSGRHPDRPSGRCRRLARRRLHRASPDPARPDAHAPVVLDGGAARPRSSVAAFPQCAKRAANGRLPRTLRAQPVVLASPARI
jgi:hypothetical protein